MAIYPVVKGQKFDPKMAIPPRHAKSQSKHENSAGNLIDTDTTSGKNSVQAKADKQGLLDDFHQDLKKDLPARNQSKKADDNDSHDEDDFHDAHEG